MTTPLPVHTIPAVADDAGQTIVDLNSYRGPVVLVALDESGQRLLDARFTTTDFVIALLACGQRSTGGIQLTGSSNDA
jgi:hypothetical protein